MIDYRIPTFLTLYELMNYRRTAEQLKLSQPAVTQQIHALERDYGCRLFTYDGSRLYRTPEAEKLAQYARVAVYNDQRMRQELAAPKILTLRLGATKTIGEFIIGEDLCHFLKRPDRTLEIVVENTRELLHRLDQEELDFALVEGSFDKSRYGYRRFQSAPFVGMCHRDHPFAGKKVTGEALADQSVILREAGSGTRAIFEKSLQESGYSLDKIGRIICVNNFALIVRMVSENLGVSFAYSAVAAGHPELTTFRLEGLSEQREFNFVYLKGTQAGQLIDEIFPNSSGGQRSKERGRL